MESHTHTLANLSNRFDDKKEMKNIKLLVERQHTHTQEKWNEQRKLPNTVNGKSCEKLYNQRAHGECPTRGELQWLIEDVCHANGWTRLVIVLRLQREIYCFRCSVRDRTFVQSKISFGPKHSQNVQFNDLIHKNIRSAPVRLGSNSYFPSTSSFVRSFHSYNLI